MAPLDDPCRRWHRDLAFLKAKAAKAGLDKSADARLADVLRETLTACDSLLQELDFAYTEHSRLSNAAIDARREWGALFDRLPCPCVCTDGSGFILKANAAAAALLAITARHLDARLLTHFAEDREQFSRLLRRAVWDRIEVHERMSIRPRDRAPILVDATAMSKSAEDNTSVLWFLQPVHDRPAAGRMAKRTGAPGRNMAAASDANV